VLASGVTTRPFALTDLDGDRWLDVVGWQRLIAPGPWTLVVWPGQDGTARPLSLGVSAGALPLVIDANRDGHPDLLMVNTVTITPDGRNVSAFLWTEAGFVAQPFPATGSLSSPVVADVDGDGWSDLVALAHRHGTMWWRNAMGTWETEPRVIAERSYSTEQIAVGDVTGDRRPDVLIGYADAPVLMLARPGGVWESFPISVPERQESGRRYHIGPASGEGRQTGLVVVAPYVVPLEGDSDAQRLAEEAPAQVLTAAGYVPSDDGYRVATDPDTPLPCQVPVRSAASSNQAVTFADVDGDGRHDVAMPGSTGTSAGIVVCYGLPYNRLSAPVPLLPWFADARILHLADVDGDGDLDAVAALNDLVLWSERLW
jgi:hypothetical protein